MNLSINYLVIVVIIINACVLRAFRFKQFCLVSVVAVARNKLIGNTFHAFFTISRGGAVECQLAENCGTWLGIVTCEFPGAVK